MDVFISPSKLRPKNEEVIVVDDSDSQSSSYPHHQNEVLIIDQDSYSDIEFVMESESFVSASDELIEECTSSSSSDDENNNDIKVPNKNVLPEESSISSFPTLSSNHNRKFDNNKHVIEPNSVSSDIVIDTYSYSYSVSVDDSSPITIGSTSCSSQIESSLSNFTSSQNFHAKRSIQNQATKFHSKKENRKEDYVDDLDDFIEQDEYDEEEEEMNSSDRRFIVSDSQIVDSITNHRICDLEQRKKERNLRYDDFSSSECDFESST